MSSTLKNRKGGGFFNLFKRRGTAKNSIANLRKELGHASESASQRRKRLGIKESNEIYPPNSIIRTRFPNLIIGDNERNREVANEQNSNLNKSFDAVLNDIKEFTSNNEYSVENKGRSNTSNKNFCHVYFIKNSGKEIEYKIRKCYKNNSNKDEPKSIEIKSFRGRWKLGPYRDENGGSFLQNIINESSLEKKMV